MIKIKNFLVAIQGNSMFLKYGSKLILDTIISLFIISTHLWLLIRKFRIFNCDSSSLGSLKLLRCYRVKSDSCSKLSKRHKSKFIEILMIRNSNEETSGEIQIQLNK